MSATLTRLKGWESSGQEEIPAQKLCMCIDTSAYAVQPPVLKEECYSAAEVFQHHH